MNVKDVDETQKQKNKRKDKKNKKKKHNSWMVLSNTVVKPNQFVYCRPNDSQQR